MRQLLVSLLVAMCSIMAVESFAGGGGILGPAENPALHADFDNKIAGQPIGSRGGVFGEPKSLGSLDTLVVETAPGQNVLQVSNNLSSTAARRVRWQMMGDAEASEGEVRISFDLVASARDRYSILVRESGGSTKSFMTIALGAGGTLNASDASGPYLEIPNAYAANVPMQMELVFDMDARTSRIVLNGNPVSSARAFGVTDRGIGSLLIGYATSSVGSAFDLDNLRIMASLPFPIALEAGFDDKAAGLPIGLGGAELNEPYSRDANINATVLEPVPGIRILDVASADTAAAQALRWHFLDNLEVRSGLLVMDFQLLLTARDKYRIGLREPTGSSQMFMDMQFNPDGTIGAHDENGAVSVNGQYDAGRVYQYRVIHNLDAGTYDIFRDGVPLLRERAHGLSARGIGALFNSIDDGALTSSHMQIDSLRVYGSIAAAIPSELEFLQETSAATQNEPVTPAIEVGVMNILDQPVPDGTPVTLEIAQGSGPPGAALDGQTATTVAGIAQFAMLSFDTPGTYRLLARSQDASTFGSIDILVEPGDVIFVHGFE